MCKSPRVEGYIQCIEHDAQQRRRGGASICVFIDGMFRLLAKMGNSRRDVSRPPYLLCYVAIENLACCNAVVFVKYKEELCPKEWGDGGVSPFSSGDDQLVCKKISVALARGMPRFGVATM